MLLLLCSSAGLVGSVFAELFLQGRFALRRLVSLLGIAASQPSRYPDAAVSSLSLNAGYTLPSAI